MDRVSAIFGKLIEVSNQENIFSVFLEDEDYEACCSALDAISIDEKIKEMICYKVGCRLNTFILELSNERICSNSVKDVKFLNLLKLAAKLSECVNNFEEELKNHLTHFVNANLKFLFDNVSTEEFPILFSQYSYTSEAKVSEETHSVSFGQILLEILSSLFELRGENQTCSLDSLPLCKLLLILSVSVDSQVAQMSASCLKWCLPNLLYNCGQNLELDSQVWGLIRSSLSSTQPEHVFKNSYIFWMRSLTLAPLTQSFQEFLRSNEYWKLIQEGLASDLHDLRKFSLSILKISLKNATCNGPIETELLKVDTGSDHLEMWKKFTTLYEIVAIDTALNQYEAASSDILSLFAASAIHPSWGLIILSTGLKASMESVRKFTVKLILKIQNKEVFIHIRNELRCAFLPALMQASFFNVVNSECPYGEKFATFVKELVLHSTEKRLILVTILQAVYETRRSFDAARVYLAIGVLRALEVLKEKLLLQDHISIIKMLFMTESEEEILQTTIQTIYLKYLLYADISPSQLIELLTCHVKSGENGYKYISGLLDTFRDFCTVNFEKTSLESLQFNDSISESLSYQLFDLRPKEISNRFLIETAKLSGTYDGIEKDYYSLLSSLVTCDATDYKDSKCILDLEVFGHSVFSALKLERMYENIFEAFDPYKFDLFVALYTRLMRTTSQIEIPFDNLLKLYSIIETYINNMKTNTFKQKDEIYANYFCLLNVYLESCFIDFDQLNTILMMLRQNFEVKNGHYRGNLSIVQLCRNLLSRYFVPSLKPMNENENRLASFIFNLFCEIWGSLNQERLVLNQQPLHLALIEGVFDPIMFCLAANNEDIMMLLFEYGRYVLEKSFSRRSFKPLLSKKVYDFISIHRNDLPSSLRPSLISFLVDLFVHEQMNLNIFNLKPVIAKTFDNELKVFINEGLYKRTYGEDESFTRIHVINSFLIVNDCFRFELLQNMVERDENFLSAKKKTDGAEEITRLLKWQLSLLTIKSIPEEYLTNICSSYIIPTLKEESSPLIRIYLEWFLAYDIWQARSTGASTSTENAIFDLWQEHSKPMLDISAERTLYLAIKALGLTRNYKDLLQKYLPNLISGCTSNKPLIRHFSNSLMLSFWPLFEDSIEEKNLKSILEKLFCEAKKSQVLGQFRAGDANLWDIQDDLKLTNIFGGVIFKITDHAVPYLSASMFNKLATKQELFEVGFDEKELWLNKRLNGGINESHHIQNSPLQTKSGAWDVVMDLENEKSLETVKRSQLIVVASLVDKAPNLGGICRLCDVLGAGTMTVHDIRIKQHPQFKNVAVTADRWMPLEQVPVDDIISYMKQKKGEGYTLIGLEQTDTSIELNSEYRFPHKSLILLGTEAFGIPGHLLSELDLCLEIKQSGVIRSMNIQTATAVVVYSYSVQHL